MFWKKKKEEEVEVEEPVSCHACKCLLHEKDAKKVTVVSAGFNEYEWFYCQKCKPPYDHISDYTGSIRYYTRVEVSSAGIPVGYKPIK